MTGPARPASQARLARLPLRVRLVAGFVAAMAVLLALAGGFVYWRVRFDLDRALDRDLAGEAASVEALLGAGGRVGADPAQPPPADGLYQIYGADGAVLESGRNAGPAALLRPAQLARATRGPVVIQLGALLPGSLRPLRVLAQPVARPGDAAVVAVAVQRDQRDEALRELLATLVLAGGGALLVAAFVGDRLARAALRPVERYRQQAAHIAAGASGVRLDVPEGRNDEITRLGRTFNDVLGALELAVDRERRFVADASHELRTPLTLLSTRLQLLRRRARSVEQYQSGLAELATDLGDLVTLSDQLLALSQPDDDPAGADGRAEVCDLGQVLSDLRLDDLGIGIALPSPSAPLMVAVPGTDLRRMLTNLITNAQLHGGPPVTVAVSRMADRIAVSVSDRGPGIEPELLGVATHRFTRSPDARNRPGAGLGLALVDGLVRRHGGRLELCSNGCHHPAPSASAPGVCRHPSPGTTATIVLPSWPCHDAGGRRADG